MNYASAIKYLNGFINFERLPEPRMDTREDDIFRFRELLTELGDPQDDYSIVHIAGTKGKGSTAAILGSVLRAAGYRVGLYTSPHLVSVRERIKVDGRMVSKQQFASLLNRIKNCSSLIENGRDISFRTVFEHLTAAAFLEFNRRKVDIAMIETGLGGRLDATVVVDPILSVLTPIGLDHTAILGDTISQIAADKACIIKPDVHCVSAPQSPEAMNELKKRALSINSTLSVAPRAELFDIIRADMHGTHFRFKNSHMRAGQFYINLPGNFQLENVSTVFTSLGILDSLGFRVSDEAIRRGLSRVNWAGRFQVLPGSPRVVLDGAHNAFAVKTLCDALRQLSPDVRYRVVFSVMRHKPVQEMLRILSERCSKFYLAPLRFPKGLPGADIICDAQKTGLSAQLFDNIPSAFDCARREALSGEIVLATGSLYLVGEIIRHIRGIPVPPEDGRIDDFV